jgi:hypothetical protein
MTSTYLDRPLIPLTVALPRLFENIEAELASEKLAPQSSGAFAVAPN